MQRPGPSEHHEYYSGYIDLVPDGDVLASLETQIGRTLELLGTIPRTKEEHRYAPGKWSIREVVGHLVDAERVFAFRALWMARGASGELGSMEQDEWAATSNAGSRSLAGLAREWGVLRGANVLMFRSFDDAMWARQGIASGRSFAVRTFPWIIAGHELHHRVRLERDYLGVGA
jgi:hypothetical protein